MPWPRALRRGWATLALCLAALAEATPVRDRHVEAELVAAVQAAQPGQTVQAALRLKHDEGWHTYWQSSSTGYSTKIIWTLPEGVRVSSFEWPAPRLYVLDFIVDYVFEGEVFLPFNITLPGNWPAGQAVILEGQAEWLMCAKSCVPGQAKLRLELPVRADGPPAPSQWADSLSRTVSLLPRKLPGWRAEATRTGSAVQLRLIQNSATAPHDPGTIYFYADNGAVEPVEKQSFQRQNQSWIANFKLADDAPASLSKLTGVAVATNGWNNDLNSPPLAIEADWSQAVATPTDPGNATGPGPVNLGGILALALLGGLILNLMPCVFPVLGIKILGFVNQAGEDRRKVVLHGLAFTAGVLTCFWILAGLLIFLRAGGQELGWGFQLQSAPFVFGLTVFLFLFGLNLSGLFEVGTSAVGVGGSLASKSGLPGSFFSGVLATVVSTPCAAPFLAPALGAALTLPAASSLLVFTAIGIGLSLPYLILSAFPWLVKKLPRPGAWMEVFKQAMAFPLYATVGFLLWVLSAQLTEETYGATAFLTVFFSLVLIALAAWIYGRWSGLQYSNTTRRITFAVVAVILVGGLWLGYPKAISAESRKNHVRWEKWAPGKAEELVDAGRIVYVDFTARWCATCQTNKAAVFSSSQVRQFFADPGVVALKADWTNRDAEITAALTAHGRSAVPFNLIYAPGWPEPKALPEVLTAGLVLEALEAARAKR